VETLKASAWVVKTLDQGYEIPFLSLPGDYEEENNASARNDKAVVEKLVKEMINKGIARVAKSKPTCVSPLGLVTKELDDGTQKHRLIFDASRWVNNFVQDQHVKLTGLMECLEITKMGDVQIVFDLTSAYYHIKIKEEHRKYLGAKVEINNEIIYFEYCHLPFGLKCAVHAITKIWKPLLAHLHINGIRSSIYIDDGRILTTPEEAEKVQKFAFDVIEKAGWFIESDKSTKLGEASTTVKYLGFTIDTMLLSVTADQRKLEKIFDLINPNKNSWDVKDLAKLLGKIISLIPSHGWIARVCTRTGYKLLQEHVDTKGWKGHVEMDEVFQEEMLFLKDNLFKFNGRDFPTQLPKVRVDAILDNPKASKDWIARPKADFEVVQSDASQFKTAITFLQEQESNELVFTFNKWEQLQSSGYRELLGVKKALLHWKEMNIERKKFIYWCTDSTNVLSFLEKGSSKFHIQKLVFEICKLAKQLHIEIEPVHLYREDLRIRDCDEKSKRKNSDNWSIDESNFIWFKENFPLEIDAFADASNARLDHFYSEFYEDGTSGVNFFAQKWVKFMWMCPPVSLLPRLATELQQRECKGIIIMPVWQTSSFYNLFFDSTSEPRIPFKLIKRFHPYIYQNEGAKSALCGKVNFEFVALLISKI